MEITTSSGDYEGKKLDELFKKKYKIADGMTGVSDEEKEIDAKKTLKYGITILENVHSADSELILRDLKLYLTKRGFQWKDQYVITDPSTIKPYEDDRTKLEYDGTPFDGSKYKFGWNGRGGNSNSKPKLLGPVFDPNDVGVETQDNEKTVIAHKKSANNEKGFEVGQSVISPGDGEITVSGDTIKIKLTTKGVEGKFVQIQGFKVDPSIKNGQKVTKGQKLGVTSENDVIVKMFDAQGGGLKPKEYIPFSNGPINATDDEIYLLAKAIRIECGGEYMDPTGDGRAACAYEIIHRLDYPEEFPEDRSACTIENIINSGYRPYWGSNASIEPEQDSINIAKECLAGTRVDPIDGKCGDGNPALYHEAYYSDDTIWSKWSDEEIIAVGAYHFGGNVYHHIYETGDELVGRR